MHAKASGGWVEKMFDNKVAKGMTSRGTKRKVLSVKASSTPPGTGKARVEPISTRQVVMRQLTSSAPVSGNGNGAPSTSNNQATSNGNGRGTSASPASSNGNGRGAAAVQTSNRTAPTAISNWGTGSQTAADSNGRLISDSNGNGARSAANGSSSSGRNGTSSSMANGSNGTSRSRSNGTSSSSNGSNGMVLARAPLKRYMPAVREAAKEVAKGIGSRADFKLVQPSADDMNRPTEANFAWAQDDYNAWKRTADTWNFFLVFRTQLWLLDKKWTYIGGMTDEKKSRRARGLARYLLESILQLGPTFIKIGQLSSTRSDLFPPEFIKELSTLQDRVPAFSADKAISIIERDLGRPLSSMFSSFEMRPIAAASLGQVHRAVLLSGEEVVVKVQRPGLKQLFDIDLENLRLLAGQLDRTSGEEDSTGWRDIYQECATVLYQEIDYINEGRNADRFRRNFATVPWVRVPVVYWECSSVRVLTLQYLPGVRITDKERLSALQVDLDLVARHATEAYLLQILRHGFFHADPHPGNLSVDTQGRLLFYDFGMMGTIVSDVRERLLDLFYATYKKDVNGALTSLISLGIIKPTGDLISLRRAIQYFLTNIARQTQEKETLSAIGEDLFSIATDQPFRFPATFTFVLRAFSTLEGIGKTLNPEFKFVEVATPYAQELLTASQSQEGMLLTQLRQQATAIGSAAAAMPLRIQKIDSTIAQMESGDLKLRVRVLEAERAARRSAVLQQATMNSIGAMGFLDIGVQLGLRDATGPATASVTVALVFALLVLQGMRRIKRLDKFEKNIRN